MKNGEYRRMLAKAAKRREAIKAMASKRGRRQTAQHFRISEPRVSQIVNAK